MNRKTDRTNRIEPNKGKKKREKGTYQKVDASVNVLRYPEQKSLWIIFTESVAMFVAITSSCWGISDILCVSVTNKKKIKQNK